ncbi:tetratricopeptide repeat protein, partial [Fulvivirga sp. RKSG066]|uniref:type IX secretion system periplasmic lipoprotein PorW/SprE n=1 Tax=Fulvivirga aurantia TaxID=2529383 RepID=UPI0012BCE5A2
LSLILVLSACSADRNNIISKAYHNTTAHFNAYFYAHERIEEIEGIVESNYDNDYNKVLKIYPEIDSVLASSYQTQIEDGIKKASIAIQRHKNSKWVDDSYILIGMARFYDLDYVNAIETFKYVNTESENDDARHEALVHLLRTFVDAQEYNNAVAVSDYLKKEKLNKDNSKLLFINRAYMYEQRGDYDNMLQNLVKAAPLLKKKDGKGRMYFIIGQIYQMLGFDAEAFNYYKKCIASNPEYELDFYARLYMAQVTELGKSSDVRAARKLFQKLLKDRKNKEFQDKIYYEMAEFEAKNRNLEKAIEYYNESVQASVNNERQKGQSFHKLGIIYYDSLRQYETAKNYYDSTIAALPKDYEGYAAIKERQEILAEFVTQINTIHLQDSLLQLASMDSASLRLKVEEIIAEEEAKKKAAEEKAEKKAARARFDQINNSGGINEAASWYFGNPSAVALGQNEFKRIWGDRPLEDNWRRASKEGFQDFDQNLEDPGATNGGDMLSQESEQSVSSSSRADQMIAQVPFSDEAKETANNKIEIALYKLGNIYNFNLKEVENAVVTFENLLNRYPNTEYEAEVLYQLYLINKNIGSEKQDYYKDQLISKYPNTTYAKLLANPNYTEESTEANEQQKKVYGKAYELYTNGQYDEATSMLNEALNEYQETIFTPRLKLLKILIIGKTEDINLYQYQLSEFIKSNPDSEITPYADELLEASRNFLAKQQRLLGTEFVKYFEQEHYFVLIYDSKLQQADQLTEKIEAFNASAYPEENFKTSNLILNKERTMIMVSGIST